MAGLRRRGAPVEWVVAHGLVEYHDALAEMAHRTAAIAQGQARERVWLVEHPPLYTTGTSQRDALTDLPLPVFSAGRGGQTTFHGPGQRVCYLMLDLQQRGRDVRAFVAAVEEWVIGALATFGIEGQRRDDRVGIWIARPDKAMADGASAEDKIAAIGIRLRHWVSSHGVSINISPDLGFYAHIVPCGIADTRLGVTSFADLGIAATMPDVDRALRASFATVFGDVD